MSWRGTVVLAVLVAVALGIAYRDLVAENPDVELSSILEERLPTPLSVDIEPLLNLRSEDVQSVTVSHSGKRARSERTAYGWTSTSTPKAVNDFLEGLGKLAVILRVDDEPSEQELEAYGLLSPAGRITLGLRDDEELAIDLGHHNPSATGIYARVSNTGEIVLTGAVAVWEIEKIMNALDSTAD